MKFKNFVLFLLILLFVIMGCSTTQTDQTQGNKGITIFYGFENENDVNDWSIQGKSQLSISDITVFKGKKSLLVASRTSITENPVLYLTGKMVPGKVYNISCWVMLKPGSAPIDCKLSVVREANGVSRFVDVVPSFRIVDGLWFNLSGEYKFNELIEKTGIAIVASKPGIDFYIDNILIQETADIAIIKKEIERDIPSIAETYKDYFYIGAAIEPYQLMGEERALLLKHFNSITPENALKFDATQPQEGVFTFENSDAIVNFANENKMKMRGHALVWHRAVPDWLFAGDNGKPPTRDVLIKRLENHIKAVVGRYKGKIDYWDVVNEPIDVNGGRNTYNVTPWLNIIGEDYIELAFKFAHEADPDTKLFINEFDTEQILKGEALYQLVKRLLAKGVPIHGVGMQFHISISRPGITAVVNSINKFRELGLEIHVTELDMTVYQSVEQKPFETVPEDILIRQGHRYKELFDVFKANKDIITSVAFWGYNDGHTFLTGDPFFQIDKPLPFSDFYKAKHAYWGIVDPSKLPPDVVLSLTSKPPDTIIAKKATVTVDGEEDAAWADAEPVYTDLFILGKKGAKAEVRVLWDDFNLYVYAFVKDDNLRKSHKDGWEQDSIEIFIDEDNQKSVDYLIDDAQYRVNFNNQQTFGGFPSKIESTAKVVPGGYIIEAAIQFKTIKPSAGTVIGFDVQVNDDQGSGKRDSYTKWNDPTNEGWRSTVGFGNLQMAE